MGTAGMSNPLDADALMRIAPVIPVLTIERLEDAEPLALALRSGSCSWT